MAQVVCSSGFLASAQIFLNLLRTELSKLSSQAYDIRRELAMSVLRYVRKDRQEALVSGSLRLLLRCPSGRKKWRGTFMSFFQAPRMKFGEFGVWAAEWSVQLALRS